jgi:hypothetical protein
MLHASKVSGLEAYVSDGGRVWTTSETLPRKKLVLFGSAPALSLGIRVTDDPCCCPIDRADDEPLKSKSIVESKPWRCRRNYVYDWIHWRCSVPLICASSANTIGLIGENNLALMVVNRLTW